MCMEFCVIEVVLCSAQPEEKAALKARLEQEYLVRAAKRARKKSVPNQDSKTKKRGGEVAIG